MTTHLGLQRILLPSAQVSSLTTGSITLPSARGAFVGSSYESIATYEVDSSGTSSITFSSIPSTYRHLQIRWVARENTGSVSDGNENIRIRFNSDSGSNYSLHRMYSTGSSYSADGYANQTDVVVNGFAGNGATTSIYGMGILDILDYRDTDKYKTMRYCGAIDLNGSGYVWFGAGNWRNTNAITTIALREDTNSFKQYSHFALYGINGA